MRLRVWKRILQLFLGLVAVCVLLLGAGLYALDWYLGSHALKEHVQEIISERSGLSVEFTGELGVSIYPWIGLESGPVLVRNPEGFGGGDMATAASMVAKISVPQLLHHELDFDIVALNELDMHLIRGHDGTFNVEPLLRLGASPTEGPTMQWEGLNLSTLTIRGLRLDKARLRYTDLACGHEFLAENVRLRTGSVRLEKPTDFGLSARVAWPARELTVAIDWMGELLASPEFDWAQVRDSKLQLACSGPYLESEYGSSQFTAAVALDTRDQTLDVSGFKLGLPHLLLSGSVRGEQLLDAPKVSGHIAAAQFTVEDVLNHFFPGLVPPKDPDIFQDGSFSFDFAVDDDGLDITNLDAMCDRTRLQGRFAAANFKDPLFSFDISGNAIDFDRYYKLFIVDEPFILHDFGPEFLGTVRSEGHISVDNVVLAGEEFTDFSLAVTSGNGHCAFDIDQATLWDGSASGGLSVDLRHDGEDKHPLALSCTLAVTDGDLSRMPLPSGDSRSFSGRGDATFAFSMPETLFLKTTNIDEVLRHTSGNISYKLGRGVMRSGAKGGQDLTPFDSASLLATATATGKEYKGGGYGYRVKASLRAASKTEPYALAVDMSGSALVAEDLSSVRLHGAQTALTLSGKDLPPGEERISLAATIGMDSADQTLTATNLELAAGAGTISGDLRGHRVFEDDFTFTGPLSFEGDPRRVFGLVNVEFDDTRDEEVLREVRGRFDLALTGRQAVLSNIDVTFDDTHGTGRIRIEDFDTGYSTFTLKVDAIDLNRYRPPKRKRVPGKCGEPKVPPLPLPLKTLSSANIDGDIEVGEFRIFDISFNNLTGHATMQEGELSLPNLAGDFYGGRFSGSFYGTATREILDCDISLRTESFDGGLFMVDVAGKQYVDGDSAVFFDIHTKGVTDDEFIANMSGRAGVTITKGSYRFSGEQNPPKGSKPTDYIKNNRTGFDGAAALFRVDHGIFMTEDFKMEASFLSAEGGGNFNLDKDTIDLHIDAQYVAVPTVIPIYIVDCLHDPGVSIPSIEILGNTVKEVLGLPLRPFQYLRDLLF